MIPQSKVKMTVKKLYLLSGWDQTKVNQLKLIQLFDSFLLKRIDVTKGQVSES